MEDRSIRTDDREEAPDPHTFHADLPCGARGHCDAGRVMRGKNSIPCVSDAAHAVTFQHPQAPGVAPQVRGEALRYHRHAWAPAWAWIGPVRESSPDELMLIRICTRLHLSTIPLALLLLFFSVVPASAQQEPGTWYAGLAASRLHVRFEPRYESLVGASPQVFVDEADGLQLGIVAGRRFRLTDRLGLGLEGSWERTSVAWTLSLPDEPASFRYALPYAITFTGKPDLRIAGGLFLFAEAGAGVGRVRQSKSGPRTSAYDFDTLQRVAVLSGGIRYRLSRRVDVSAAYRAVSYPEGRFESRGPSGIAVERVRDTPRARAIVISATSRF